MTGSLAVAAWGLAAGLPVGPWAFAVSTGNFVLVVALERALPRVSGVDQLLAGAPAAVLLQVALWNNLETSGSLTRKRTDSPGATLGEVAVPRARGAYLQGS